MLPKSASVRAAASAKRVNLTGLETMALDIITSPERR